MKKICVVLSIMAVHSYAESCPPSWTEVCDYSHGTFYHLDNQFGVSLYGLMNNATFSDNSLGSQNTSAGAGGAQVYWDYQSAGGFYWGNNVTYQTYLGNGNYAADQADYTLKLGWSWQPIYDYWQITPYATGNVGAGQLNWDSNMNYGAGIGLRTEVALITRNSLYADYNYQLLFSGGNFENAYQQQFGITTQGLSGNSNQQTFEFGYKHVFNCSMSLQAYYRYVQDNIGFNVGGATNNYSNNTQVIGVGLSWYTGG